MAQFDPAFTFLLSHEGTKLYRNRKTGEVSRYGITLKLAAALRECAATDETFIETMTEARARAFYQAHFWSRTFLPHFQDQGIASKFLDIAVHMGEAQATKLLQRACNVVAPQDPLDDDGVLGRQTLARVNALNPETLMKEVRARQAAFYIKLAHDHPVHADNLDGWLVRAAA